MVSEKAGPHPSYEPYYPSAGPRAETGGRLPRNHGDGLVKKVVQHCAFRQHVKVVASRLPSAAVAGSTHDDHARTSHSAQVIGCSDICRMLLPSLPVDAFLSLRMSCSGINRATQAVCEELVAILEKAATLYVSPRYVEALKLVSAHQPHRSVFKVWLCGLGRQPGADTHQPLGSPSEAAAPLCHATPNIADSASANRQASRLADSDARARRGGAPPLPSSPPRSSPLPLPLPPTPTLIKVTAHRYEEVVASSYHLLQAILLLLLARRIVLND